MRRSAIVLAALLAPAALRAQLPDASPRSLALGGAYGAMARGFEAVAWNPAMLAVQGRPGFTLALPRLSMEVGSNTYSWADIQHYANRHLTDQDKQALLTKIGTDSSLTIRSIVGVTPIGFSIGPFAFLAATSGNMDLSVGRDAVELALYGNAHRAGAGQYFTARGSGGNAWAATTLGVSFAHGFAIPAGHLAVGATYKVVIGHFLGRAQEVSSSFTLNPLLQANGEGQALYTDYASGYKPKGPGDILGGQGKAGSGFGVDLGGALQLAGSSVTVSATLVNLLGKMTWDQARFTYERTGYTLTQTATGGVTEDSSRTILRSEAAIGGDAVARSLRDSLLAHADFARLLRLGVALRSGPLTISGGAQVRLKEGLDQQPAQALSGGVEYRLLGILPLRAGANWDFGDSFTLAAGTGLKLAFFHLDASAAMISGNVRPGVVFGAGMGLEF